jgi:hypothetical protein
MTKWNLSRKFRIDLTFENYAIYFLSSYINRIQDFKNKKNKADNIILSPVPLILRAK